MALVAEVTKVMPDDNNVKFHLKLTDGVDIVIDKTYPDLYSPEVGPTAENKTNIQAKMQIDINAHKKRKEVFDRPAYGNSADDIQSGLEL